MAKKRYSTIPEKIAGEMHLFITEISEALYDKTKGGKDLSVLETAMFIRANEILKQINGKK